MVFKQDVFLSKNRRKTPIFGSKTSIYHKKTIFMTTFINYNFTGVVITFYIIIFYLILTIFNLSFKALPGSLIWWWEMHNLCLSRELNCMVNHIKKTKNKYTKYIFCIGQIYRYNLLFFLLFYLNLTFTLPKVFQCNNEKSLTRHLKVYICTQFTNHHLAMNICL